jgi:hypothetical protein
MFLVLNYWETGKQLVSGAESGYAVIEIQNITNLLDGGSAAEAEHGQAGFLGYPATYEAFQAMLRAEFPSKGERAWKDRWGNDLAYYGYLYQSVAGYQVGSAGADGQWRTEDDIWSCRWGEKRWGQNLGGEVLNVDAKGKPKK